MDEESLIETLTEMDFDTARTSLIQKYIQRATYKLDASAWLRLCCKILSIFQFDSHRLSALGHLATLCYPETVDASLLANLLNIFEFDSHRTSAVNVIATTNLKISGNLRDCLKSFEFDSHKQSAADVLFNMLAPTKPIARQPIRSAAYNEPEKSSCTTNYALSKETPNVSATSSKKEDIISALKGECEKSEHKSTECIVCMDNKANVLFSCSHCVCCVVCAKTLDKSAPSCPKCRTVIVSAQVIKF